MVLIKVCVELFAFRICVKPVSLLTSGICKGRGFKERPARYKCPFEIRLMKLQQKMNIKRLAQTKA